MHLKSVVASGFKSFAEKTTINLSEYTNVIVGPNGSGKSNIVDAISWVLGNQSPGSLRTNKMEDVIFAGTEKLGEKGFAEVYLVFDLDDNTNFNSSEVSIGRKLYRDGTSEYFMNGLACRLLDIQEFLNDVGIGKQQHIIISQGQITEILNAKPEDHRITIEEASGILPYKLKKDKALKRIESGEKGFAEVYLVFDLDDNTNFNSSEVSIGRKLYRDGTSEYFMNGLACRLLDIQEFLNDVGIGKQQHIIISQGQITEILNAKPEDHRITIEEASGILPYKLKKDKALKRIESGDKEIKRAKDVLREIKKQIDPLRKQAEQAQLHKQLSEILKFNKTNLNILQYRNFNKKYEDIKTQLEEVNRFIKELESKLENFKVSKNKLRKDFGENVSVKSFLSNAITEVNKFSEEFKSIYQISTERQLSLERIKEQSSSELKRYTNQIHQNNNQISQLSKLIIDKKDIVTVNSKKIESLNIEIEDVKSKQSSSLEVNEALLKNEIKFLKIDLSSKTDILDKFTDNLNNWIKDEKYIGKHLTKHDKFLKRKKLNSRSFNKVKIHTDSLLHKEITDLNIQHERALLNKNEIQKSLDEKLSLINEYSNSDKFKQSLKDREDSLLTEKEYLENETSSINEQLISSSEKIKYLTDENKNLSNKVKELNSNDKSEEINNYEAINLKASQAYKILNDLSTNLSERNQKLDENYSDNDEQINEIEENLEDVSKSLFNYKDKKSDLMVKESEYMSKRALYYSNLTNISGLSIEQINQYETGNESIYDIENVISKTENELDKLGTVNYLASEDFESLNTRYEDISSNIEELNTTKKELLKYINEIEEEIKFRIENSFNTISVNFEEVFEKLFPGGKGSLTLTNPENLLESGIEISVQPRGKKVKKLSLLSGGERSLAAIAFLFSVFKSFPSPFYILDEVEAALDDANLHRMLNLLEFVKEDAQFLIVTHQQQTMQAGDVLYGVTMQPGSGSRVFTKTKKDFETLIKKGE